MDIYWNSHKKLFSCRVNGKVISHVKEMFLIDCKFVVSQKGRERVLKTKSKNVHAVIRGSIAPILPMDGKYARLKELMFGFDKTVKYDPYTMECFTTDNGSPIHEAPFVWCVVQDNKPYVRTK